MKKDGSLKQRLTSLDIPMTRPANLFDMDLSNALDSFQPGNIEKEDMPNVLPIFNRQTDKFEKLMKKKRPSSMPVYPSTALRLASVPALHKELPQLPTKIGSADNLATNPRSVSMYLNLHSLKSCDDDFITPLAQTFNKPKHIIVDDDTDTK
ncbi:hypothetical protein QCA50_015708 [Cerrena zonata]|uniref:Uncharacterized protein n=1 Tax=Cerrena zonata TaxID=2478898 RepID=A0AAW0FQW1_9APHY